MALIPQMTEVRQLLLLKLLRRMMRGGGGRLGPRIQSRATRKQNNKFFVLTPGGKDET